MTVWNYTKGEWKVEEHRGETNIATEFQNIAKMCFDDSHTLKANAHLIAAAPDMYEALKEIKHIVTEAAYRQDTKQQIIAGKCYLALAKAEEK